MKPIVKKIIESGLVEKSAIQLMEKWGQIDRGSSELVGAHDLRTAAENSLTEFAEEVEELIEKDREEIRETRLAIQVSEPVLATWLYADGQGGLYEGASVVMFKDTMGNFLFPIVEDSRIYPGAVFQTTEGTRWTVLTKERLFVGDHPYAIQTQVRKR